MTVFALYGCYFNNSGPLNTMLALYTCQDNALEAMSVLESSKEDERDSYFVKEIEVQ